MKNLKKLFLFSLSIFSIFVCKSQSRFGNEWINFNQNYYKIQVTENGIYKIDYNALIGAGLPVTLIDPRKFQLFYLGKEQPIYIHGEADGKIDPTDVIEFFGKKNDGTMDAELYESPLYQPHPFYSFVSDTSSYFLTWLDNTTPQLGLRYSKIADYNYSSYTPASYYLHESRWFGVYDSTKPDNAYAYGVPTHSVLDIHKSEYTIGEGYTGGRVGLGSTFTLQLPSSNYYSSGPTPYLNLMMVGLSDAILAPGTVNNHHVRLRFGNQVFFDDSLFGFYVKKLSNIPVSGSLLGASSTSLSMEVVNDLFLAADWNGLTYAQLFYPRSFNLSGSTQLQHRLDSNIRYIRWQNYGTGIKKNAIVYDLINNQRISTKVNGTDCDILMPNTLKPKELYIQDSSDIKRVTLSVVYFQNINPQNINYNYLIVTHPAFINKANDYKNYNSTRYRNFNTLIITTEQLFDQFFFGQHHPLAIRHFCDYMLEKSLLAPEYLLLLGKGEQTNLLRNKFNYSIDFVPSIGVPSSDNMFTTGLKGSSMFEPAIPTGRVAAKNESDIENYLQKLKEYEAQPDTSLWRKEIMHLSGGDATSASLIATVMNDLKNRVEGISLGGRVTTFSKNSTSAVVTTLKAPIIDKFNSGVSMMTFYGHGALNNTDIEFGDGCELSNKGKYPFLYLNGCNVGNANIAYLYNPNNPNACFTSNPLGVASRGEVFITEKDKGAIGILAHSNQTIVSFLNDQMSKFYLNTFHVKYGESIGKVMQQTIRDFQVFGSEDTRNHSNQWLLQGDPALRIFSPQKPDYAIYPSEIFVTPFNTSATSDSFAIGLPVHNYGKATSDSFSIGIKRTYNNGSTSVSYPYYYLPSAHYLDTFFLYITSKDALTAGNNIFEIKVDANDSIDEYNESNNMVNFQFFMPGNGINLLEPDQYGIVPTTSVTLVAQASDLFTKPGDGKYYFEIDTSHLFNSPIKQSSPLIVSGALAKWSLLLPTKDSTVYYWRARLDLPVNQGGYWMNRSFTYINGSPSGWSQSHFPQFYGIRPQDIEIDTTNRNFGFSKIFEGITVLTRRWSASNVGIKKATTQFLNPRVGPSQNNFVYVEFDRYNLQESYKYLSGQFPYSIVCYRYFDMNLASEQLRFQQAVDSIKDGNYVAAFSRRGALINNWSENTYKAMEKLGSKMVRGIKNDSTMFVFIGQKGNPNGTLIMEDTMYSPNPLANPEPTLRIDTTLQGTGNQGKIYSELVGPASKWGTFYFRYSSLEAQSKDSVVFTFNGVKADGTEDILIAGTYRDTFDLSAIDANKYPYLRIVGNFNDLTSHTSPQLKRWQVIYQGVPEGTIEPLLSQKPFSFYSDTLVEGDSLRIGFAFVNISKWDFKPLKVNYSIYDLNSGVRKKVVSIDQQMQVLKSNDTILVDFKIGSLGLKRNNQLVIFVNPLDQPEKSYNNNTLEKTFFVKNDGTPPLLDVTVDGVHLRNGDIVAPNPIILITSKDENKVRLQNDTSKITILFKESNSPVFDTVRFNSSNVHFTPASAANANRVSVEFMPKNLADGTYDLKVQAADMSGNYSSRNNYEINFEVVNEKTATKFYPYPNPFSTSMKWVFTLTGKVPDDIYVDILNINGRIVKQIRKEELGFLHVGHNVSEYSWDGTDMYGDKLANGVYLYKVYIKDPSADFKERMTKGSKYFVKDFGKIYLMR